jgi:membrane protease YdiL (CAAX protease family)
VDPFSSVPQPEMPSPPLADAPPHEPVPSVPPWTLYTVAVSLTSGYILIPLLASQCLLLINPFLDGTAQLFCQQSLTLLAWLSIFVFLRFRYGAIRPYIGLNLTRPKAYYAWETVRLTLVTASLLVGLNLLWTVLGKQPAAKMPYAGASHAELLVLSLFAVFMAPVLEEVIFRGLVQSTFHKLYSPLMSVFMTSLVFLVLHGNYFQDFQALSQVMILGFCFGLWRERTQSILPGIMAHLFNNALASIVLLWHAQ